MTVQEALEKALPGVTGVGMLAPKIEAALRAAYWIGARTAGAELEDINSDRGVTAGIAKLSEET